MKPPRDGRIGPRTDCAPTEESYFQSCVGRDSKIQAARVSAGIHPCLGKVKIGARLCDNSSDIGGDGVILRSTIPVSPGVE